jgi:hypothetical protein
MEKRREVAVGGGMIFGKGAKNAKKANEDAREQCP